MNQLIQYFQEYPFFLWALIVLVAALVTVGTILLVRIWKKHRKGDPDAANGARPQKRS